MRSGKGAVIELPEPVRDGSLSVEAAIDARRSVREYVLGGFTVADLSQLLWAAQGVTHKEGLRSVPSAGALYPLDIFVAVGDVPGLDAGVYCYSPGGHSLTKLIEGDLRRDLSAAALGQESVRDCAVVIAVAATYRRVTRKYGERGVYYAHVEVGSTVQNVYLQAVSLDLGTVVIGAFEEGAVGRLLGLSEEQRPLALLPVGRVR